MIRKLFGLILMKCTQKNLKSWKNSAQLFCTFVAIKNFTFATIPHTTAKREYKDQKSETCSARKKKSPDIPDGLYFQQHY